MGIDGLRAVVVDGQSQTVFPEREVESDVE